MFSYQIGEVFVHMGVEDTQELLEEAKKKLQEELTALRGQAEKAEEIMSQLKIQLYAKFGDNINLEPE